VRARDLLELTKPRLSSLVLVSAGVGMLLCPEGPRDLVPALLTMAGTALVVGGANAWNSLVERELDARMRRTRGRPLPSGAVTPRAAALLGSLAAAAGLALLWITEPLAAILALVAFATYVFAYTPFKRRSSLCTLVGAIPGALPPVIGWVAVSGEIDPGAWLLFAWLFVWQPPHFLALAYLHREDYRAAGMPMLPVQEGTGGLVEWLMVLYAALLVPLPALFVPVSRAGAVTLVVTPLLGLAFLAVVLRPALSGTSAANARLAFSASITYLGLSFAALVLDVALAG
jgi:protoheme IX farnesyltransferase